jgi:cytochrome c nitrite reductase small subunit
MSAGIHRSLGSAAAVLVGALIGVAGFTFVYARGSAYLGNDPSACANCHVMRSQLDGWLKSSHHNVASCNDCHTPPGLLPKYAAKALNGFLHSLAFTTGRFPEPIHITDRNRRVTEAACRTCHQPIVERIEPGHSSRAAQTACIACHPGVGHMENVALGSVDARFRASPSILPPRKVLP